MAENIKKIMVIAGPTAAGKSGAALKLAKNRPSVIINADSMQVYQEIPVISAQPGLKEQQQAPHSLYGFISARAEFSTGQWLKLACQEIDKALAEGIRPIVVGGTGLYFKSLIEGMAEIPDIQPEVREDLRKKMDEIGREKFQNYLAEIDPEIIASLAVWDKQRLLRAAEVKEQTGRSLLYWQRQTKPHYPREWFDVEVILPERAELYRRCDARFLKMLEHGALEEARNLRKMKLPPTAMAMKALGVKELSLYLDEKIPLETAIQKAQQSTRNYAKRQYTWFRNQMADI